MDNQVGKVALAHYRVGNIGSAEREDKFRTEKKLGSLYQFDEQKCVYRFTSL